MYKILFYEDAQGFCPFESHKAELDEKAKTDKNARIMLKKIVYCLELIQEAGTRAGEKFTKQIEGELWELRVSEERVFFFLWNGNHIVLLHSFRKETNKTPKAEIEKAKREMDDWKRRYGH
jgi:phage-related protein